MGVLIFCHHHKVTWIIKGQLSDEIVLNAEDTNNDNIPDKLTQEKRIKEDKNIQNKLLQHQLWRKIHLNPEEFELSPLLSDGVKKLAFFTFNQRLEIIDHYGYESDIAILKLLTPLKFDAYVGPACLPPSKGFYPENFGNINAIVSGWGHFRGECGKTTDNYT